MYRYRLTRFTNILEFDGKETATPATMRQTQVLVIPSSPDLKDWHVFDQVVTTINNARRNARDYVTDVSFEKLDERVYGEGDTDWMYVVLVEI